MAEGNKFLFLLEKKRDTNETLGAPKLYLSLFYLIGSIDKNSSVQCFYHNYQSDTLLRRH